MNDRGKSHLYDSNFFAIGVASALFLGCVALACAALALAPRSAVAADSAGVVGVVPLCAWARHGRVGLWWNSTVTPTAPIRVSHRYNALCIAAPWSPALPGRGRPAIDVTPWGG